MKQHLLLTALVIALFVAPLQTQAILVGSFSLKDINSDSDKDLWAYIWSVGYDKKKDKATATSLSTRIFFSGAILRSGNALYYTNRHGIQKHVIGQPLPTLVYRGASLNAANHFRSTFIIQQNKVGARPEGSFLYNVATRKKTVLTPAVVEITATSFSRDGKLLAVLGKNKARKQKLFLSGSSLANLIEFDLPRYATSCSEVSVSPLGTAVHVGCTFDEPKKPKGRDGSVFFRYASNKLGSAQRSVQDVTLGHSRWLSESRLLTVETTSEGETTVSKLTIVGGKVYDTTPLLQDVIVSSDDTTIVYLTTASVARLSDTDFLYQLALIEQKQLSSNILSAGVAHYHVPGDSRVLLDGVYWLLEE